MTLGELQEAARAARNATGPQPAAAFEVEIQKKFALAVGCVILALAGAAMAIRFPRGGRVLALGASLIVFPGYYLMLVGGELLADRHVVSPWVGMWTGNAVLLLISLLPARRSGQAHSEPGALAIGG
ncbi:MAG: LptF/LptG family permease [Gemmatimonadales bacterium]